MVDATVHCKEWSFSYNWWAAALPTLGLPHQLFPRTTRFDGFFRFLGPQLTISDAVHAKIGNTNAF